MKRALEYNPNADVRLIEKAYDFAENSHEGQKRLCGRPFFMHCKDVAYMLVKLRLDTATICAGLLHDVLEDTGHRPEHLNKIFGDEILGLVQGVTKIKSINLGGKEEERAENVRKVLLATIKDIRVILIKLADRLHNMRTLKYMPEESRKAVSRETLDIYVPVAYKLGMYKIKSELEDLCLKYLDPSVYQELKLRVSKKRDEREGEIKKIIGRIKEALVHKGLKATITGRAKNFHSIYRKMVKKGITFDLVHDLSAIRIIAESPDDCYRILGILHSTWTPILKNFDDYIATPKPNMYQSLHTEMMMDGKPVEVQIRTWTMHHVAEEGIAAHWLYKDTERDKKFDRRIAWLKQILDWRMTSASAKEFVESLKIDLFKDEIYVITPKGDAIPLPEGATPVDFAYAVHTDVGNHCVRAKVNNAIMPLDTELKSGDVVEILTSKNASPSRNWLQFVKTGPAMGKIRHALGIVYVQHRDVKEPLDERQIIAMVDFPKASLLKIARCCSPQPGDGISGYRIKDGKVAVHKALCDNLKQSGQEKWMPMGWKLREAEKPVRLRAEVIDRTGLFQEILGALAASGIKIAAINTKNAKDKLYLILEVKPLAQSALDEAISAVKRVRNVVDVRIE